MENPLNYLADNPNNIFEQAKKAVGEKLTGFLQSDTGQSVVEKAAPALSVMEKIAIPYRDVVAPTLSAVLLELNSNYRAQNKDLSLADQVVHAFDLSKAQVEGKHEWQRSISPGRALVGLLGNLNFRGDSGTEKIDWSNSAEVDKFFTSGSAQFWSGAADLGFNILDPVAIAGGKVSSISRKAYLTRPVGSRWGRVDQLSREADEAVTNLNSNTGAAQIFKMVEKDPENIRAIQNIGIAATSSNPVQYAVMLSNAFKTGGRAKMADVIKASVGNIDVLNKLKNEDALLHAQLMDNANSKVTIQKEIEDLKSAMPTKKGFTPEEVELNKTAREELGKKLDELDEQAKTVEAKRTALEPILTQEFRSTQTWSKSGLVERVRNGVAEAKLDGIFIETDGGKNISFAKEVAKGLGTKTPYVRAIMWLSPTQQLREHPGGVAFVGGAAGEASFKEFDARLAQMGRLFGMSKKEMIDHANDFRRYVSKSERFTAFERLQDDAFRRMIEKHYGEKLGNLSAEQQDAIGALVRGLADETKRAQRRELDRVITRNYTVTDIGQNHVAYKHLEDIKETAARERAMELRGSETPSKDDYRAVELALRNNQLTETQVPYVHFGVDMQFFDRVMGENPRLIGNVVDKIINEGWDASRVASALKKSAETAALDDSPTSAKDIAALAQKASDNVIEGIDSFYTYVWKPFTLLSFKYTSRNVVEGYLRVAASMIDFASYYGYGYTDMFKGFRTPGAVARTFQNRGFRKSSKKAYEAHKNKVEEIKRAEGLISKQLRAPSGDAFTVAKGGKKEILSAIERETFIANDSVSMTLMFSKRQLNSVKNYKTGGDANAEAIHKILKDEVTPAVDATSEAYGSPAGTAFVKLLAEGEYQEATKIARQSSPKELIFALQQYRDEVDLAYSKIMDLDAGASNILDDVLENIRFSLGRFFIHADDTIKMLGNKALLEGELTDISAKGSLKKSYSGSQQVEIYPGVFVDASFAGDAGEMLRNATSSRVSTTRTISGERRISAFGLLSNGSLRSTIERYDPKWATAHTEYVNNVIMKDAVMRHMVEKLAEGKSVGEAAQDALEWIRTSRDPELIAWKREVKGNMSGLQEDLHAQFGYEQQVKASILQIESHLPSASQNPAVSYAGLYEKALKGFTQEDSARIALDDRISVTASADARELRLFTAYKNAVSNIFRVIGTLPEDSLVRHPFFNMVHDAEMKRIVKQYERYGKKNNLSHAEVQKLVQDNADRIKTAGVNRAYKELMQRLYSVERYTTPGQLLRWVAPFYMAHQNSSRFWLGISIRNPDVAWNLAKLYNAPYRAALVYDENGEVVKEGNPWEADANKQRITLETPQWLRGAIGKDTLTTNPSGFDVITQGQMFVLPTLGGFVGEIGGQELIKYAAKNTNADAFLRDKFGVSLDEFSQKYILPFYDKTYGESIANNIANSAMPFNSATVSGLAYVYGSTGRMPFGGNLVNGSLNLIPSIRGRWETRYNAAREQITVEMLMNNEPIVESKLNEEAIKLAATSLKAEAVLKFSPTIAAFQPVDKNMSELNARLTTLQSQDYNAGGVAFIKELENRGVYNAPAIMSTLRSTTVDNKYGLNANIATIKGVQANIDSFSNAAYYYADNPFLGELFNQDYKKNPYSKTADELMYSTTVNGTPLKDRKLSPAEADRQAQIRAAWQEYFTNIAYIEEDAKKNNIKPDSDMYKANYVPWKERLVAHIGEKFPAFNTKDATITLHKSDRYVALAQYFLQDQKFMNTVGKNNETIAGLKYYMEGRQAILDELEVQRERTGTYGLDTKTNHAYYLWTQRFAEHTKAKYPAFAQMYDRYFSKDEYNKVESTLKGLE